MITLEVRPWPNEKNTKVDFVVAKIFLFDKRVETLNYIWSYKTKIVGIEDNFRVENCIGLFNYLCQEVCGQIAFPDNVHYEVKAVKKSYTGHSEPETVFIFEFK